jgi:integral membrane protein
MKKFLTTKIGRLRLVGMLEGVSLLVLLFIAMPVKYMMGEPGLVRVVGMIHGVLFVLFILNTLTVAIEYRWKFTSVTWMLLLASFVPFGTFYVDKKVLSKMEGQ